MRKATIFLVVALLAGSVIAADSPKDAKPGKPANDASAPAAELTPTGPTDVDPTEQEDVKQDLAAISDGGLVMKKEEMPAYYRILNWVDHQPATLLRKRAKQDVLYSDFRLRPDSMRLQIVELNLTVRQIIAYTDAPKNGVTRPMTTKEKHSLYEVRGFTREGGSNLYFGVVPDLPKGMPVGTSIKEDAKLVGYFFKLQGYISLQQQLDAERTRRKPVPLKAPVILGRLMWTPPARAEAAQNPLSQRLPVLSTAKPVPEGAGMKVLALDVQVCTKCAVSGCDALATLIRETDEHDTPPADKLRCEKGHVADFRGHAIANGKICLNVQGHLFCKEARGKELPGIDEYLKQRAASSRMAANLTAEQIVKEGKELPDVVVIRADAACRFGAVNYIITKCQELGYRSFALKISGSKPEASNSGHDQTPVEGTLDAQRDRHPLEGVADSGAVHPRRPSGPGEDQFRVKLPPPQPIVGTSGKQNAGADETTSAHDVKITKALMVTLLDDNTGSITNIQVAIPIQAGIPGVSVKSMSYNELDNELRTHFKSKDENDAGGGGENVQDNFGLVVIIASSTLRWEEVVRVIDKCAKLTTAKDKTPDVSLFSKGPDPGD